MNIAINGFGRIGRGAFKALLLKPDFQTIVINDLSGTKTMAHLLKYDSCYHQYGKKVSFTSDSLIVDGAAYRVIAETDPEKLPWRELGIDIVLECSGKFTDQVGASEHVKAGAKKVIISAPGKGEDIKTFVLGVNEAKLKKSDQIISMASCTTNCLAPITEVIRKNFGIKKAIMTTVHSYTADQNLIDKAHKDLRRARAAGLSIIPTTTGAARATAQTIPSLAGKFDGLALRVPTPIVSLCDIVYITNKKVDETKVNQALISAAAKQLKGILQVSQEPLVSTDFIGNSHSAIVDLPLTKVIAGDLLKIIAWYDNEWGYSCRLADLCVYMAKNRLV